MYGGFASWQVKMMGERIFKLIFCCGQTVCRETNVPVNWGGDHDISVGRVSFWVDKRKKRAIMAIHNNPMYIIYIHTCISFIAVHRARNLKTKGKGGKSVAKKGIFYSRE